MGTTQADELLTAYENGQRDFYRWVLGGAHLEGANLRDINLLEASLIFAHVEGATLARALLVETDLECLHAGGPPPQKGPSGVTRPMLRTDRAVGGG